MSTGAFSIGPRDSQPPEEAIDADTVDVAPTAASVAPAPAAEPAPEPPIESFAAPAPAPADPWLDEPVRESHARSLGETLPTVVVGLAAVAWIGAVSYAVATDPSGPGGLLRLTTVIGVATAPLALLAVLWLVLAHSGRGEARRYARTSRAMRLDSQNLAATLGALNRRLDEGRRLLDDQTRGLDRLGGDTLGRFAETSESLRRETEEIRRLTEQLARSSAGAREDIQLLLRELPSADERSRALAQELRGAGMTAKDQVDALERALHGISEQAHMADMQVKVSAERLQAQLGQLGSSSGQTVRRIEEATTGLNEMVAGALEHAGEAIDGTRRGVAEQAAALTALAEQARAALGQAGVDQTVALGRRLEEMTARIDGIFGRIAGQDASSAALVGNLEAALDRIEERFATFGAEGAEQTAVLAETLAALADHSDHVARAMNGGTTSAGTLLERVTAVRRVLDSNARDLEDTLPASLSRLRLHAERSLAAVSSSGPHAEQLSRLAEQTAVRLAQVADTVDEQNRALDRLGVGVDLKLAQVREHAAGLHKLIVETGQQMVDEQGRALAELDGGVQHRVNAAREATLELNRLVNETGQSAEALAAGTSSRLIDAMVRVRETATHASDQAKAALSNMLPALSGEIADAVEQAVDRALAERMRLHLQSMVAAADEAVEAADKAALRMGGQLGQIAEAADRIKREVAEVKEASEKTDQHGFSRQVALLVESLNSSAIDVAKLLSTEVSDTAWASYLKGDRGVFTRRAVRLLDTSETRELLRHYAAEPDFREQVNRYIHDFEAMLRRVLSAREGGPLSVTLLSSDMGKLYVALAQAIERLRS